MSTIWLTDSTRRSCWMIGRRLRRRLLVTRLLARQGEMRYHYRCAVLTIALGSRGMPDLGGKKTTRRKAASPAKKPRAGSASSPSQLIEARIAELDDWRGKALAKIRKLIKQADPGVVEEWKWRGVPVWSHDGLICTGETYKAVVKMTFAKGASLNDPAGLFNSSLDGKVRRAIDVHEGDEIDEEALKALIRSAVALNAASRKRR